MKEARTATRRPARDSRKGDVARAPAGSGREEGDLALAEPAAAASPADALRGALLDSRQRWRDLVTMACDIAFETDARGRLVFVAPDRPLGWSAERLVGQPTTTLLAEGEAALFDPFLQASRIRGRRAWLRRADGAMVCLTFHAAPMFDASGGYAGSRGVGQDVTEQDGSDARMATSLRRGENLEFILARVREEVLAPRMMQATLEALAGAIGAAGAVVVDVPGDGTAPVVMHHTGRQAPAMSDSAVQLLRQCEDGAEHGMAQDGRPLLACPCRTRFGEHAGLVLWRSPGARPWDEDERALVASASTIVRMVLEHESIQREMARQARTDPLTALLNRRALLDEVARRIDRLDREGIPGTLMFVDLDHFKQLNDSRGHDVGDEALCVVAHLLRAAVRPSDLVARFGGDEFAVWMDGCDELAAAERAEMLRIEGPRTLAHLADPDGPGVGMSIGIATRWPGRGEHLDALIHRADQVMYEVKRNGRGHWRVSRLDSW